MWPFMATVRSLMAFILNLIRKLKSGQWLGTGLMVTIVAVLARARILSSSLLGSRSECQRVVRLNTTACVRVFGDCRTRGVILLVWPAQSRGVAVAAGGRSIRTTAGSLSRPVAIDLTLFACQLRLEELQSLAIESSLLLLLLALISVRTPAR